MHPLSESSDATAVNKASSSTLRCLITGANGMIGHALQAAARKRGIEAVPVQRPVTRQKGNLQQPTARPGTILWSPEAAHPFADLEALEGFDAVIHLAGANLSAHRWTAAYKKTILESRTLTTGALALALARLRQPPKVLLSASATGFYGSRGDEVLTEDSPKGSGFLSDVCQAWENATAPAEAAGIAVAHLRFGVVLTPYGGALKTMLPLFRAGAGGRLGSGTQWMSWISLEDLLNAVFHVLGDESLRGAVNLVAPEPVLNRDFTQALGAALHRPAVLPAPAFALRAALGQVADEALLASCRARPQRLQNSAFQFVHTTAQEALASMLQPAGRVD
jgi:uncharacterized protein (TIGR01777 family)